jgi:hypothetical protein
MIFLFPVFVVVIGHVLLLTGDTILFRSPFSQVHESASLRAEGPERIPSPGCFFLTHRTNMFLCLVFHFFRPESDCLSPVT